jgi:hypothetical protein
VTPSIIQFSVITKGKRTLTAQTFFMHSKILV